MAAGDYIKRLTNYDETLDDFPTPRYATRALVEHVIGIENLQGKSVLEPSCGRGHIVETLKEYDVKVVASDVKDYGYPAAKTADFTGPTIDSKFDFVITNPPYKLAEEFFFRAMEIAECGVALLVRDQWMASIGRYDRIFSKTPPTDVAIFSKHISATKGKVIRTGSCMLGHVWLFWDNTTTVRNPPTWLNHTISKTMEKPGDFDKFPWETD